MAKIEKNPVATAIKKALHITDAQMESMEVGDLIRYSFAGELSPVKLAYLAAYAEYGIHSEAAKAVERKSSPHRAWMLKDKKYKEAYEVAQSIASEKIVDEIKQRAIHGVKRKRFYQGEPIIDPETGEHYVETEYSDQLIMFLAKGLMPEVFRERSSVEISGGIDVGDVSSNTAREIARQDTEFLEQAKRIIANQNRTINAKELPDGISTTDGKQEPDQVSEELLQEGEGPEEVKPGEGVGEVQTDEPGRDPREVQEI